VLTILNTPNSMTFLECLLNVMFFYRERWLGLFLDDILSQFLSQNNYLVYTCRKCMFIGDTISIIDYFTFYPNTKQQLTVSAHKITTQFVLLQQNNQVFPELFKWNRSNSINVLHCEIFISIKKKHGYQIHCKQITHVISIQFLMSSYEIW
jgi:hypothetical protein